MYEAMPRGILGVRDAVSGLLLVVIASLHQRSVGEVVNFDVLTKPDSKAVNAVYVFYASVDSVHGGSAEWQIDGHVGDGQHGIAAVVVPMADFRKLFDSTWLCSTELDVRAGSASSANTLLVKHAPDKNLIVHTFTDKPQRVTFPVHESGVYFLAIGNCGDTSSNDVSLVGSMGLRNSHGYLPGNMYPKLVFNMRLTLAYSLLFFLWLVVLVRLWVHTSCIQWFVTMLLLLGLADAALGWIQCGDTNSSGNLRESLFFASLVCGALKLMYFYRVILTLSKGVGVTCKDAENVGGLSIQVACAVFIVAAFGAKQALAYKYTRAVSRYGMLLNVGPMALLSFFMFAWVCKELSRSMQILMDQRLSEHMIIYKRLRVIMFLAMWPATTICLLQILDTVNQPILAWPSHWLLNEGLEQIVFVAVIVALMCVLMPGEALKLVEPSEATVEEEEPFEREFEDDREDQPRSDVPQLNGVGGLAPQAIGATGEREEEGEESLML